MMETTASLAERFRVLGDPMRLKILALLGIRDACVCELVDLLPIGQSAVSRHLRRLRAVDLVDERRDRQWVIYSRNPIPGWLRDLLAQVPISPEATLLSQRPLVSACGILNPLAEAREERNRPLIYFICTGNSARSQMAEGWADHMAHGRARIASGGLEPAAAVHPLATAVMAEVGIDIRHHTSKPIAETTLNQATVVITLCGDAQDRCPVTPPHVQRLHWPLPDPARATGTDPERLTVFRSVRDDLRKRIERLLSEMRLMP